VIRLALLLALFFPASADASVVFFQTPSHNIGCAYSSSPSTLRCDIRSGLRPRPPRPGNCDVDWGDSYGLGATGRATITCHGDTAIDARSRVIRYGSTWRRGPFTCRSRATGLRCRNRSGHGFFMSRQHSYRF
jgi:hypothetical protein